MRAQRTKIKRYSTGIDSNGRAEETVTRNPGLNGIYTDNRYGNQAYVHSDKERLINELPNLQLHNHLFHCPCCGGLTAVQSPRDFIFMKLVRCEVCRDTFAIENNKARRMA